MCDNTQSGHVARVISLNQDTWRDLTQSGHVAHTQSGHVAHPVPMKVAVHIAKMVRTDNTQSGHVAHPVPMKVAVHIAKMVRTRTRHVRSVPEEDIA